MANTNKSNAASIPSQDLLPLAKMDSGIIADASKIVITTGSYGLQVAEKNKKIGLANPHLYFNRELTWLNFNRRVLYEAENKYNPHRRYRCPWK